MRRDGAAKKGKFMGNRTVRRFGAIVVVLVVVIASSGVMGAG